jgi:carbon starvation protein CstA
MAGTLSDAARAFRNGMLALIMLALFALFLAFSGAKGWIARETVPSSLLLFAAATCGAGWLGIKGHRRALADRERASGQFMIVAIAAQLGKQDEETLRKIAAKGGPAAAAAKMILDGRRQKAGGSSIQSAEK